MYLRFVSPLKYEGSEKRRDLHMGLFQALIKCRDDVDMPAWLHRQLVDEFQWFKDYLPSPDEEYFDYMYTREFHPDAICWFKASAKCFIDHAWTIKALIEEAGIPFAWYSTQSNPGAIAFEDEYPNRGASAFGLHRKPTIWVDCQPSPEHI